MSKEELAEIEYASEEEFVADILGIEEDELDSWFDAYDPN